MAQTVQSDLLAVPDSNTVADEISDRLSQELVIALVGPVASGVSTAVGYLENILTQEYGYKVAPVIKPSDIIRAEAYRVEVVFSVSASTGEKIGLLQTAGNKLREKYGPDYLAEKAVEKIVQSRRESGGYREVGGQSVRMPGRRAYIIDSIKNIEELDLLRKIYGDTLCLVGVFAPDSIREERLVDHGVEKEIIKNILDRDQGEVMTFGQMTRKVFVESDFFICNDQKEEELRRVVGRYLHIIFDTQLHTPTRAESAMYNANAVASNSACMSRQVGAAIMSQSGELIAVGWNDVPKFGGGLYNEDDQTVWNEEKKSTEDQDRRCFKHGRRICHNEVRRKGILESVAQKLEDSNFLKKSITVEGKKKDIDRLDILKILAGTEIDSLIEFSRSIHAEMEAILSVAREGRHSLVGGTLYTTTYPCHNCARHIVASGLREVIYIQPYLKSLATDLHGDSVTEVRNDSARVVFRQYDGVAPRNFLKLFKPKDERKQDGKRWERKFKDAVPVFRVPLDSPVDYEAKVIVDLSQKEQDEVINSG